MSSKPKQSAESKELERIQIEREKQLRVENARETTKAFADNMAFRKKLRGIFSLLSGGFEGFPNLGAGGGRQFSGSASSGGGGSSAGPLGGGGTQPRGGTGGRGNTPASGGMNSRRGPAGRRTRRYMA